MRYIIFFIATTILAASCQKFNSDHKNEKTVIVQDVPEDPETRAFINFWKEFSLQFDDLDTASVRKITLDSIWLWSESVSCSDFIKRYYDGYSNSGFSKIILDTNKMGYSSIGCHPNPPVREAVRGYPQPSKIHGDACLCRTAIIRDTLGPDVEALEFTFLETTRGYKLFGINFYTYAWSSDFPSVDTTEIKN